MTMQWELQLLCLHTLVSMLVMYYILVSTI